MEQRQPMQNRLALETSPYLLQHASNPVDWFPWGREALDEACRRGCPILLSVGYSACHWCHVMEHESFSDPAIAALMNQRFVCVKVDREERPDIDAVYMAAVQAIAGQGGWPMTVFLTPDLQPFYGGTYFPPEDRHGMPGFRRVLDGVAEAWDSRKSSVTSQAEAIAEVLRRSMRHSAPPQPVTPALLTEAADGLLALVDDVHGGFGRAPKFPQPMAIDFLLRHGGRTGRPLAIEAALAALRAIDEGGIHDQIGGGFHRYATDIAWRVPHFEKMLSDNAQLALSFLRAWRLTGEAALRRAAERTLDYIRREMTAPWGGFYASQDADTEHGEGAFTTWTPDEVAGVLDSETAQRVCESLNITKDGMLDGRSIPHRSRGRGVDPALDAALETLRQARVLRPAPATDRKVIVSWNALMLGAFAEAAMLLARADYLQTAVNAGSFLLEELTEPDGANGLRVRHTGLAMREEDERHPAALATVLRIAPIHGMLDDYALLAEALLRLHAATGEHSWSGNAKAIADTMLRTFATDGPLLSMSPTDTADLPANPTPTEDNAVPSGNAVAASVLIELTHLTGDAVYRDTAARMLRGVASLWTAAPLAYCRWLSAAEAYLGTPVRVHVYGDPNNRKTQSLADAARGRYVQGLAITVGAGSHTDASEGALQPPDRHGPCAVVCVDSTCRAPVSSPQALAAELDAALPATKTRGGTETRLVSDHDALRRV